MDLSSPAVQGDNELGSNLDLKDLNPDETSTTEACNTDGQSASVRTRGNNMKSQRDNHSSTYIEMTQDRFSKAKRTSGLSSLDMSRKGNVDEPILELIRHINGLDHFFTTSSCSGRTIIVGDSSQRGSDVKQKKGCEWLYVTHGLADLPQVVECLREPSSDSAVMKFEPFILHIQCASLDLARQLMQVSVASGYRNSGISLGKSGKIILAVRSTAGLEVPLVNNGELLVAEQYVQYLVNLANKKMEENFRRIARYYEALTRTSFDDKRADEQVQSSQSNQNSEEHIPVCAILSERQNGIQSGGVNNHSELRIMGEIDSYVDDSYTDLFSEDVPYS